MKRNTLIAQITLGTFICLATAQISQAMEAEPTITLESADGQLFVLPQSVAFISDYVQALKTGGFLEATQEGPLKLPDIPGEELNILVQIMNLLHENQAFPKEIQAAAVAQMPLITSQNIDALINDARFLQLPESCIAGLIDRLAEFVNRQVAADEDIEIPFDDRKMLTQLGRTYFLKYDQDLELADAEGNPIDIDGFSIRELLDAGRKFHIHREFRNFACDLKNRRINSLDGLLDIPEINECQRILLNRNRISSIQPDAFRGLSNLRFLLLNHNQITSIQAGLFQELTHLQKLDLSSNQITSIQPGTFRGLSNLKEISLANNQISSIQFGTFQGLANLRWFELDRNQISSVQPGTFQGLANLNQITLDHNQISTIQPGTFQGLTNLLSLTLGHNQISTIQPGTFQGLTDLRWFELSFNSLSADTIERVREELPPGCELEAQNQREETPEERRAKLAEATERRMRQKR